MKQAKAVDVRSKAPDLIKKLKEHPKGTTGLILPELYAILFSAHDVKYASGMKKADVVSCQG